MLRSTHRLWQPTLKRDEFFLNFRLLLRSTPHPPRDKDTTPAQPVCRTVSRGESLQELEPKRLRIGYRLHEDDADPRFLIWGRCQDRGSNPGEQPKWIQEPSLTPLGSENDFFLIDRQRFQSAETHVIQACCLDDMGATKMRPGAFPDTPKDQKRWLEGSGMLLE